MNERIKQLAEQAGVDFFNSTDPEYSGREYCEAWTEQQQKFAELIIQECVAKCEFVADLADITNRGEMARKTKATANSCADLIKQHFGVES